MKRACKAFTLIELMIVLALAALTCTLMVPLFKKSPSLAVRAELEKLSRVFIKLQQQALATAQEQKLQFSPIEHSYSYKSLAHKFIKVRIPKPVTFGFVPGTLGPPANPEKQLEKSITFGTRTEKLTVRFFPDGTVSSGALYLADKQAKITGALTCAVSQVSYVRAYLHDGKNWQKLETV